MVQLSTSGYHHTALLYAGPDEFIQRTLPFIRAGVAAHEPTLVAVAPEKIDRLRAALGGDAQRVDFADMNQLGSNPARIIPAWHTFIDAHPGQRLRGIGEPIYPGRSEAELVESQHLERLLNRALMDAELSLMCPYDTRILDPEVIAEAHRSHPTVSVNGRQLANAAYAAASTAQLMTRPLPAAPASADEMRFSLESIADGRRFVASRAARYGLTPARLADLVLAFQELAANSVQHGGGSGTVRLWREHDEVLCEVRDRGVIDDPLVGRRRPEPTEATGYGLWVANRLCDLVQLRSGPSGTVIRLHMRCG